MGTLRRNQQSKRKRQTKAQSPRPSRAIRSGRARDSFPIVGIGASAGGLEALDAFLRNVPDGSGLAFVVVQHLDPTRDGIMVELLQRATSMRVLQVEDRSKIQPNHVYVIPPNKDISVLRGVLHLFTPAAPRGLRLPIDFFFRSLAADQRTRSIGVILSGMGSDGTLGLRAIKEQSGGVFVQLPESAKFDGMPRSAIDAGLADVVAPAIELPARIIAYLAHVSPVSSSPLILSAKTQDGIEKVCALLRTQTGHDFSPYKRSAVYRRVERRMGLQQLEHVSDYVRYLRESPQETQLLLKELLIGVTGFFRDPAAWDHLEKVAIPALLRERSGTRALRAWVPGCSTGEEAYSLAIAFNEALALTPVHERSSLQIFATDLETDAIERARRGFYRSDIAGDVPPARLHKYFTAEDGGYRVIPQLRETVIFATQNVISDPPFTKLDIVSCRNLLIYLAPELQRKLLGTFHYGLNPRGILFLGSAETAGSVGGSFSLIGGKTRIYRRSEPAPQGEPVESPSSYAMRPYAAKASVAPKSTPPLSLQASTEQVLLQRYTPAAVLTNEQGDILYVNGRTGKYLEPAAGKANLNIHAMARDGLRHWLHRAFQKAVREKRRIHRAAVELEGVSPAAIVDVTIDPLQEPEAMRGTVLVVFAAAASPAGKQRGRSRAAAPVASKVAQALRRSREELRTMRDEMQTSQEELMSSNEELQSTNEELQSTNEELTTSQEEMQSLNEELHTLNHELQTKVDELSQTNDDMRNLLDSTDIATLFLDESLRVRRFTTQMSKIVKLIPGDVNRPITDLASDLIYPELACDAQSVLATLAFKERPIRTFDGRWFSVRIMPYRTVQNRIRGVVITFMDITAAKTLEATLRTKQLEYEA